MADSKLDSTQSLKSVHSKKATQSAVPGEPFAAADQTDGGYAPAAAGVNDMAVVTVVRRKRRYLIGLRRQVGSGFEPHAADPFIERLTLMDGVEIVRRLRGRSAEAAPAGSPVMPAGIVVARMDEQRGEALRLNAPPHVIVEIDEPLLQSEITAPADVAGRRQAVRAMPFPRRRREFRFLIQTDGDRPIANAAVSLYGPGFPVQGVTDAAGRVALPTFGLSGDAISAVYVRPAADYWERIIQSPSLDAAAINVIHVAALRHGTSKFAVERPYGWGQRLMSFDRVRAEWNGAGVRVGLIDSGCDSEHPLLRHVAHGVDFTLDADVHRWKADELGQGTHCAGLVAGLALGSETSAADQVQVGTEMIGCAPGAELHVFKVVPGGHYSDLLDALDQCIERRLDLVQIGVCGATFSELVAQKITDARLHGVACITGAGNGGGAVEFPGCVPGVLTVAALGKWGEYPPDSRHAQRAMPSLRAFNELFCANFSAHGREVGVCAPGVAVLSSVPGGGYAAWDGTAMAAAHVTGFATLLLAHHGMLQSIARAGGAERRVAALFDLICAAAAPPLLADAGHVGAGLPDWRLLPAPQTAGAFAVAANARPQLVASLGISGGAPQPLPAPYLGDPLAAIMQLRAAGLWI